MSSSTIFFLLALCFTSATASPFVARYDYPPPSGTPTVPVPICTKNCTPPVVVPPRTKNCTTPPVVNPQCTKNCTPPIVNPPCTTNCPLKVPVDLQSGCHPNFAGAALTLSTPSGALFWLAKPVVGNPLSASTLPSRFFFQQTGFPIVSYTVQTVENNNFALEVKGGAPLIGNNDSSGSNQNQKWVVDCSWCASTDISITKGKIASGCRISSDTNKQCITSKTNPMTLTACDGSGDQLFDITSVTV
ncbi:hypothetical protein IW261DRAFT_1418355 [Armillaria novae-zelandiae]|uniref:Ricin B lectin domain-containing protein n=1 Tax=Armillaria novae-zelandiae TaxID=153914 RepID=A0AA39UGA5_9AGAR|nr:hypothetical protein IW261DRAFT_1418355 [Armillaria novae-zelandiae]